MRGGRWIVAGLLVAGVATAEDADRLRARDPGCGHLEEILAARQAAAQGDSELALEHLRRADALLERCMREGPRPPQQSTPNEVETG